MKKIVPLLIASFCIAAGAPHGAAQVSEQLAKPLPSWAPEPHCMKEFERTTQHCPQCAEQRDNAAKRMQEEMKKCTDALQKVYDACGIGKDMNEACYKKRRPYLEANCAAP
jgi:hypothetical protein